MNLRQKAIKGVVWSGIQSWGTQAIAFIVFFVLARLLAPEAFGLVALAGVFLAFVQLFIDQGLSIAIVQRQELEPEHLDSAFWTNLGISLLLTLFGIAVASIVADLFKEPQLTPILRWLSLSFLLSGFKSVQQAIFQRQLAFKALAIRSLVAVVAGGVIGVVMAFLGFGVWSLVGKQLVKELVGVVVLWGASDWRPGFNVSVRHFKELFSFGMNLLGIRILEFFNVRADDFLIGYFLGPVALGYYTIAYKLLQIMLQLLTLVTVQVVLPTFSRLQQEPERMRRGFYQVTQLTSLISFPIFLGMATLAPQLVPVLFGKQWEPSIPVMQVLAFVGILISVEHFISPVIMAMGKPSWKLVLTFINSVTNVVGFAIAVRWGIAAVAASYVIRGYLLSPLSFLAVQKLIRIELKPYLSLFLYPILGSIGMVVTIVTARYYLDGVLNMFTLLAVCVVIGILIYGIILFIIAPKLMQQILTTARSIVSKSK
jgi:O-antigen/teichoic acid export membrane protein